MFPDSGDPPVDDEAGHVDSRPGSNSTVLVVDDEGPFARTVALWLDEYWTTMVATDGEVAVQRYGPNVDAVLLDRRMPRLSGDEVLEEIRAQDGSARVAMMTALEPDLDVVDMDFDMYLGSLSPVRRSSTQRVHSSSAPTIRRNSRRCTRSVRKSRSSERSTRTRR